METLKRQPPDVGFVPLRSPESNPIFKYDGFNPSTTKLPVGHTREPGLRTFEVEVIWEKDVAVKMRDGAILYTDIFRPTLSGDAARIPAIIAWSPYGKAGGIYTLKHRLLAIPSRTKSTLLQGLLLMRIWGQ